jgi:hypothetical protein
MQVNVIDAQKTAMIVVDIRQSPIVQRWSTAHRGWTSTLS